MRGVVYSARGLFYRIDRIDEARRASEFRELKEFREFREALPNKI